MELNCGKVWVWGFRLAFLLTAQAAFAHPMGNFSINHYTRLEVRPGGLQGRFVLDVAEIPTVTEMSRLDANQDGVVSELEKVAYLRAMSSQLSRELTVTVNEQPAALKLIQQDVALSPGAGGLQTLRLTLDFTALLPFPPPNSPLHITYKDANYPLRTGWKEIILIGETAVVRDSSVPATDLSKELTVYPTDPAIAPPQVTEARFTLNIGTEEKEKRRKGEEEPQSTIHNPKYAVPSSFSNTPYDAFTQSIAKEKLTTGVMLLALLSAFGFGALHALSPGHGKAMVAAYLIGTKGTVWHAVLLGLVVTLTHTVGVFVLGLITLWASRWIVPERLYPIISGLSGLAVAGMGLGLLWHRLRMWRLERTERAQGAEAGEDGDRVQDFEVVLSSNGVNTNGDDFAMQRRTQEPMPLRTLIGLGITGGALPCPSALVVMLSAIALHRIGFGLLLIVSFSLGLAVVLTVLGLLVMRARGLMERASPLAKYMLGLSVLSAGAVTIIGLLLLFRSLTGKF